jgi:hypothetical protein
MNERNTSLQTSRTLMMRKSKIQQICGSKQRSNKQEIPCTTEARSTFFGCKKQILAQQPFLVHEEKTLTYLGFEPGTFGFQVGNATN